MIISVRADEAILFTSAAEVDGSTHAAIRLSGRMSGIRSWILRSSPEGSLVRMVKNGKPFSVRYPLKQLLLQNIVDRSVTRFLFRLLAGIRNDGRQYWNRQTHCQTSETIFIHTQRERIMSKRGSPSVLSAPEDHHDTMK